MMQSILWGKIIHLTNLHHLANQAALVASISKGWLPRCNRYSYCS